MKYFIVGLHSSGKQEVLDMLEKLGISCGKLFSNIENPTEEVYNSYNYELYSDKDINDIFENNAYVFIQELQSPGNINSYRFFEGLSKYSFDQHEVFAISPDQLLAISQSSINEDVCFVWLDNTKTNRRSRYRVEKRSYNFNDRDYIEKSEIQTFVKFLYSFNNSHVLYFSNEDPARVATIIYSIITHPDLLEMYVKNFN